MDSQKEIQVVALNKTETQRTYQCFPPEFVCGEGGWGGGHTLGIRQPNITALRNLTDYFGMGGRRWVSTLDVSARKLKKLCINLKARPGVFWHKIVLYGVRQFFKIV